MNIRFKFIPNLLTAFNLICGFGAIYCILNIKMIGFLYCFTLCLVFDSFDGWYARNTKTETIFGKKFDAFADVFSFGIIITTLIYKGIFVEQLFWQIILAGWFTFANIIRYFKLVAKKEDSVYGVPNVVISIFIVALYFQDYYLITLNEWTLIISITSFLMLVPVKFLNHKKLKNNIFPQHSIFGLVYTIPLLFLPFIGSSFFWVTIAITAALYISTISVSIAHYVYHEFMSLVNTKSCFWGKKIRIELIEFSFYLIVSSSIIIVRMLGYYV